MYVLDVEFATPVVSTEPIARSNIKGAIPETNISPPFINPAPPLVALTLVINPSTTSETVALAPTVAPPPVIGTWSPTLYDAPPVIILILFTIENVSAEIVINFPLASNTSVVTCSP